MIRRFSATWVFTLRTPPLKNGIVEVDEDGVVVNIVDTGGRLSEHERMIHHSGIIAPGFVNAHCHLELSHLRGITSENRGLMKFLGEINLLRTADEDEMLRAAARADLEMHRNGISACGDVSNSSLTLDIKKRAV
jgi:aminodeoxyfutalosine deaminase